MKMEFEGILKVIGKTEEVGNDKIPKLTFVIEEDTDREYKGGMAVELFRDKIELINGFKIGDKIKIWLNFRAREYNDRWFTNISAWRIEKISGGESSSAAPTENKKTTTENKIDDDLPF